MTATLTAEQSDDVGTLDITGTWGVLCVATSREAATAERLSRAGFTTYCPAVKVRRFYRHRKVIVDIAVYPNYIFAAWNNEYERHEIRRSRDVTDIIHVPEWEYQAFVSSIEHLQQTIEHDPFLDVADWAKPGVRVRVTEGAMKGVEGEIIERRGRTVLVVGVRLLGRCVETEIDPLCVERV